MFITKTRQMNITQESQEHGCRNSSPADDWFLSKYIISDFIQPRVRISRSKFEGDGLQSVINVWLSGILAVLGIVGNMLSLWVLSHDRAVGNQRSTLTSIKALV